METTHPDDYQTLLDTIIPKLLKDGPHSMLGTFWFDLGDGFHEIKWSVHRIYCSMETERRVFALLGVEKRFKAFQSRRRKHVTKCERRRAEIRSGSYDETQRNRAFAAHRARRGNT